METEEGGPESARQLGGLRGDCLTPPLPPLQGIPLSPAPDHPWQLPAFLPQLSKWLQPQAVSKLLTSNPGLCRGLWPLKKKPRLCG